MLKTYEDRIKWQEEWHIILCLGVNTIDANDRVHVFVLEGDDFITGAGDNYEQAEIDLLGQLGCM